MSGERLQRLVSSDLCVGYGRTIVAGPWTGEVRGGGLAMLLGPNGAGKTTAVRTFLGLLPPVRGRVALDPPGPAAYVPQLAAFDDLIPVTVAEVVGFGRPDALPRRERRARVQAALAAVGLPGIERVPFFHLSGGQRQRVLVARALLAEARFIVLDEPTSGVDAASSETIWTLLRELATDPGRLVLVVTHDLFAASRHATTTLLLEPGGLRVGEVHIG